MISNLPLEIRNFLFPPVRIVALVLLALAFPWACGGEEETLPGPGSCLALTELFTFTDSDYQFHITGKVKNFSPANADGVVVTADLFSDPDHQLPILSGSQQLPPIPGGEGYRTFDFWSPAVSLLPASGGFPEVFFEAQVRGAPGGNEPLPVPELELEDLGLLIDVFGRYHVRVSIFNTGRVPVEMVYLTVSFFRDEAQTDLIVRLRRGFGRFLGTPEPTVPDTQPRSPEYILDLWHPEITWKKYPVIYYRAELSQ